MSSGTIDIDRAGVFNQLNTFGYIVGDLEGALAGFPTTADVGPASSELSAIVSTLKAKAEYAAAAERGLSILVLDVADKLLAGDQEAADVFDRVQDVNFDG